VKAQVRLRRYLRISASFLNVPSEEWREGLLQEVAARGFEGALVALGNEDMTAIASMADARDDPQIEHLLGQVGRRLLGEQSDWCTDAAKISKLADALGAHSALMFQLRELADRQGQIEWLEMVLAAAQERDEQAPQAAGPGRYSAPVYDEGYQLYYRYDSEESVYEWCADPHAPSSQWMSQSAADAMVAGRVSPQGGHEDQQDAGRGGTGDGTEPAWAWDDGWGMFYRIGASGVYEYCHSVDDAHTRPDGVWLSGEQVLQQRQRAEAARSGQPEQVAARHEAAQGERSDGGHVEAERGQAASSRPVTEPLDLESALAVFERAGVSELREVIEDIENLFAELKNSGVA
jgi:hypothetical protein